MRGAGVSCCGRSTITTGICRRFLLIDGRILPGASKDGRCVTIESSKVPTQLTGTAIADIAGNFLHRQCRVAQKPTRRGDALPMNKGAESKPGAAFQHAGDVPNRHAGCCRNAPQCQSWIGVSRLNGAERANDPHVVHPIVSGAGLVCVKRRSTAAHESAHVRVPLVAFKLRSCPVDERSRHIRVSIDPRPTRHLCKHAAEQHPTHKPFVNR
jgi:hypothetical protein